MSSGAGEGVEATLKSEVERLSRELDQASSEKVQSAQYGLVLLEEKESLQQRCDDLELLYENTKHDLHITQEVTLYFSFTSSCISWFLPGAGQVPDESPGYGENRD